MLVGFLVCAAALFGWLYLHFRRLRRDDPWEDFRRRHRARLQRPVRQRTMDPTFQFDPPATSPEAPEE